MWRRFESFRADLFHLFQKGANHDKFKRKHASAKIFANELEEQAMNQVRTMINHQAFDQFVRIMSRSDAKEKISKEKAEKDMGGIETSHIPIDEAPDAYKPVDVIQEQIVDTVDIIDTIKPVLNVKA